MRVADLTKRYGMRPSDAEADLMFVPDDTDIGGHYELYFDHPRQATLDQFDKMAKVLGCNDDGMVITNELSEMEDIVDRALSLAPSARSR